MPRQRSPNDFQEQGCLLFDLNVLWVCKVNSLHRPKPSAEFVTNIKTCYETGISLLFFPPSLSLSFPSLHLSFLPLPDSKTVRNPRRKSQNARAGEEAKGLIISCSTTVVLRGKLRQGGAGTCSGPQSNLELLTPRLLTTLL